MTALMRNAPGHAQTEEALQLGAALVILAGRTRQGIPRFTNAGPAAYALLSAARTADKCGADLDLLLLVAADDQPRDDVVEGAARAATGACPRNDVTPLWLLAEYDAARAGRILDAEDHEPPEDVDRRAEAAALRLVRTFPHSSDAWAATGDLKLRRATYLSTVLREKPFTARSLYTAAAADYRRAAGFTADPQQRREQSAGLARALLGAGEPQAAVEVLRQAAADSPRPGEPLEVLVAAQEADHDFPAASATARRQVRLGPAAYPGGRALAVADSLSTGAERFADLSVSLQPDNGGAGGGSVTDASYIPSFRPDSGPVGTKADCPDWTLRRDEILSGHPEQALAGWPATTAFGTEFRTVPTGASCYTDSTDLRDMALLEAGQAVHAPKWQLERLRDERQNLWRWAGDLGNAAQVTRRWLATAPRDDATPVLRLGEISYLRHRYAAASAWFSEAAVRTRQNNWQDDLGVDRAELDQSAALLAAHRTDEALALLRGLAQSDWTGALYQRHLRNTEGEAGFAVVAFHARALLADTERRLGEYGAAEEDYAAARYVEPLLTESQVDDFRPERIDNNQALADLALHRTTAARRHADQAVRRDPASPVFLFTSASSAEAGRDYGRAIRHGRAALHSDPGAFAAANNLGVDLARRHRWAEAAQALRRAVGVDPAYALAWFNLGVVESHRGFQHLFASQGALGRAFSLEPELSDRQRVPRYDAHVYETGIDVSKPLPPHWSFATLQRAAPATSVGLLAAALLAVGLVRGSRRNELAEQWLEPLSARMERLRPLRLLKAPVFAIAVTVCVLWLPGLRHPGAGVTATVATLAGYLLLVLVAMLARVIAGQSAKQRVVQRSWAPGMVLGAVTTAVGAPWAPLPVVEALDGEHAVARRIHLAAPITLAAVALVLFALSADLQVPMARSLAVAALVMSASTLLPVAPLDGARIGRPGAVVGAGAVAAGALVMLGLL